MDQDKKIILIPGWMNGGGMYGAKNILYDVLEVWKNKINPKEMLPDTEYLIGHSLGCNWALLSWEKNKNIKLILVNPLLPKRKIREWFSAWREFCRKEKQPVGKEVVWNLRNVFFGLKMCWKLLTYDFDETIKKIPEKDMVIVHGEKDLFYCDEKFRGYAKVKNIKLIEVVGVGHDWHEKFDREIEKIIE